MLTKIAASGIVFLTILLSIGCDSEGVFENPDSIMLTTFDAIQGKTGHVINVNLSNEVNEMTKHAVLEIWDKEVSEAVLYVVVESADTGVSGLVELFNMATDVAIVSDLPEETKPWTNLRLNLSDDGSGDPFVGYLQVVTPVDTVYLTLWGTLSQKKRNWFLAAVAKPPEIIGGTPPEVDPPEPPSTPAMVSEISYYSDRNLSMPLTDEVFVGDAVYTKVVFSKEVPIVFADTGLSEPSISSSVGSKKFQYRMRPRGTDLQSGDTKPHRDTNSIFICRYGVRTDDFGRMFRTFASHRATSGTALRVIFFVHTDEPPPDAGEIVVDWQPHDFVGQVYTTQPHPDDATRSPAVPVPGVVVTIVSGPRSGESTLTDRNGRYRFLNVDENELHLRVEKRGFEPKEVVVSRSGPTSLPDGSVPNYHKDPQKESGNILIGQVWPDEVRPLLEETLMPHDLLYIEGEALLESNVIGYYGSGIVFVFSKKFTDKQNPSLWVLKLFEHEIAHAHQHAVVSVDDGTQDIQGWVNTFEGRAYVEAKQRDLDLGEKMYYDTISYYTDNLLESAAEHCANYWREKRGAEVWHLLPHQLGKKLEELAPNRFRWAEEWLTKK